MDFSRAHRNPLKENVQRGPNWEAELQRTAVRAYGQEQGTIRGTIYNNRGGPELPVVVLRPTIRHVYPAMTSLRSHYGRA